MTSKSFVSETLTFDPSFCSKFREKWTFESRLRWGPFFWSLFYVHQWPELWQLNRYQMIPPGRKIGIGSTFYRALPSTFKKFTRIYHWVEIPLLLMIHSALTSTHFSYWFTKIYSTKNYHLLAKPLVTSLYYPVNRACKCGVKLALGYKTFTLSIYRTVAHCIAWQAGDNKKSLLWSRERLPKGLCQ